MKKIKYFIFSLLIMFIGIFDVYGFSGFSDTQKNALKKFLKSFEYPSRLLGSCRYSMAERPNSDTSIDLSGCIIDEGTQSIIDWVMNLVRIGGVVLLVVLGMLDFVKAAASGEQEEMKKSKSKFVKRLIACVVLFFVPIIVDILVGLVNLGSGENCNSNDSNDKTDDSNNRVSYQCSCKYYRSNVDEPNISDVSLSFDVTNKDNFDSHTINYNGKNVTVKINSPQKNATSSTDMLCPKKCSFDESKKVLTCSSKDNDETFQNNNPHFYQAADENGKLLENCKIPSN